ncbi:MAG: C25 family cysteine peptidase [Melioribacteraceae bacterium]|nr:C25 family cysteine peptidase [Melioribacteraceae bacterium]
MSDNWYAIWGDGPFIPQLKVGRIPMLSVADLNYYLQKITNNYNSDFSEWNKKVFTFFRGSWQ